jgi:threonine/homoserine/homoserine lactone efflux protein
MIDFFPILQCYTRQKKIMGIETYIIFLSLSFIVCISPGPSMLFMIQQELSKDIRNVFSTLLGLLSANIIWINLCASGVGALLQKSQHMFQVLTIFGAVYLLYLGMRALLTPAKSFITLSKQNSFASYLSVFTKGTLTSLSNPKALLFYMAFSPQFVSGNVSNTQEILRLGILNLIVISFVMLFYGASSKRFATIVNNKKYNFVVNTILGASFIAFGLSLLGLEQSKQANS